MRAPGDYRPGMNVGDLVAELRVEAGNPAHLAHRKPASRLGLTDKNTARLEFDRLLLRLDGLHNRLWAEATRSVLLVLQGLDASGKDGAIRRVLTGLNPQGCDVTNFKVPNDLELAHDYLWRGHVACPRRGILGAWNRSHYEDVVTARVLALVVEAEAHRRYRHIRELERMLVDEGTTPVKTFLHISKDEQRARLQARVDDPQKNWKFRREDLETRAKWDRYQ